MSTLAPIIEAEDLRRYFGGRRTLFSRASHIRAVDGINLQIKRGETFAIVGESGCGKSTLARLLAGLLSPTSGQVCFEGSDLATHDPAAMRAMRRQLQFVFQDPFSSLNPRMRVGALVGEPLRAHGTVTGNALRERVTELLRLVGLRPEYGERYPHEFSGGQRQRIGIARALACEPSVIIADEPVSALDVSIQAQVINLLEELKAELGLTLVIIAHDLAVIRHMADRVAVMYLGEIVETAPAEVLFRQPQHPYTEALLAAIPSASRRARPRPDVLEGDPPNPAAPPAGCRFHTRCAYAEAACREKRPELAAEQAEHQVACHLASNLQLSGIAETIAGRTNSAKRRFELYRNKRAAERNAMAD